MAARRTPWALGLLAALIALVPLLLSALSPLQTTRDVLWITGSLAGVASMSLLFLQPLWLLASSFTRYTRARHWHRWGGVAIVAAVLLHVGALYVTSPPDVLDALLFVSPTPFSVYGVTGLIAVLLLAVLSAWRMAGGRNTARWRMAHGMLGMVVVVLGGVHAWLIDGTMSPASKLILALAALVTMLVGMRRFVRWPAQARVRASQTT